MPGGTSAGRPRLPDKIAQLPAEWQVPFWKTAPSAIREDIVCVISVIEERAE